MAKLFGEEWVEDIVPLDLELADKDVPETSFGILIYRNVKIGVIAFSPSAFSFHWDEKDNYKVISLIHEKFVFGKPYLICTEKEKMDYIKWNNHNNTPCSFDEFLSNFPKNILELQTRSLMLLYQKYPKYGFKIKDIDPFHYFAEDDTDFVFILDTMLKNELIKVKISPNGDGSFRLLSPLVIAERGWIEIQKNIEQNYSKQVFIAMNFSPEMDSAYLSIKKAITELGYDPMRIDKKEHNNEISGEILYEIKNSYFIIADVTGHRNGVYFEAGFAMGHNKPIIWCCKKSDKEDLHFDTRQYNHILWENEQQLYERLKDRILGTIKIKE